MESAVHRPVCLQCGVDDFLIFESFTPAADDGPGVVSYTCSACESFAGHGVPSGWTPPGWRI
jgi:hypothetical protein